MSNDTQRTIIIPLEEYGARRLAAMQRELSTELTYEQFLAKYCIELPKQD
jgi:hypothetical protein